MSNPRIASGLYTATINYDNAVFPSTPAKGKGEINLGPVKGLMFAMRTPKAIPIRSSWGAMRESDALVAGSELYLEMTLLHWNDDIIRALWPYSTNHGAVETPGIKLADLAGELRITAIPSNTENTSLRPLTIFHKVVPAPDRVIKIKMGNEPREIPITFKVYPHYGYWFQEVNNAY
ncbi:MAG: hypothetical protein MPJ24_02085 [Pirellulaceae bacterium]|nr:hypothetical protein [Pirellulaceae bacterium]